MVGEKCIKGKTWIEDVAFRLAFGVKEHIGKRFCQKKVICFYHVMPVCFDITKKTDVEYVYLIKSLNFDKS